MSNQSLPTVDEIVNTLKRSFIPTILIEGKDDVFVYRWLKSKLNTSLINIQACGGRKKLFSIHDRRSEFFGKKVIFIADKDAYRFDGVPEERDSIIFTSGYCIENDIFEGSNISDFLDDEDKDNYDLLRKIIVKWFAFEVDKYHIEKVSSHRASLSVATHVNVISPIGLNSICPQFSNTSGYVEPDEQVLNSIIIEYNLNVRGKQLFQMLSRFLSKRGRFSSFSEKNLVEIALKQGANIFIEKLVADINFSLSNNTLTIAST